MYQFTNQSVYLSLSVYVSVCQSIHLGFLLPSTLSVGLCICLSAGLSAYIHHYIFDVFSACSFVCLSVGKSSCLLAIREPDCQSFCFFLSYYLYLYLVEKDPPSSPLLMEFFNPSLRLGSSYTTQDYITYRFLCFFPSAFLRLLRNRDS